MASESFKYVVFIALVLVILSSLIAFAANINFFLKYLPFLILLAAFLYWTWRWDVVITLKEFERAVIYRFGKINRVGGPGWAFILPPIETFDLVDLRVQTIDIPKQDVITKDSIELKVDAVIYLRVKKDTKSVTSVVVEVEDYKHAVKNYVISSLRDVIGTMNLASVIANIDEINNELTRLLEKISEGWGISVDGVQLKDVDIPRIVIDAMHAEKAAVQEKLARIEKAYAHKAEIDAVKEASEGLTDRALSYYYMKALEELSRGKSTKFIFPMEFSRLAESVSGKLSQSSISEGSISGKYEEILKAYINNAVSEAKKKEGKNKIKLDD